MLIFPMGANAQELLRNETDARAVKLLETHPVPVKQAAENAIEASLRAEGKAFFLRLSGTGTAAHTVNRDDLAILLLENDSTVTVKATAVQGYNDFDSLRSFSHEYFLQQTDLEMLSRSKVQALRKYSVIGFDEFNLDEAAAANLKSLCTYFLQVLDREKLLKKVIITEPAFPGGKEILLSFINKNLKQLPILRDGERKSARVQFQVNADGSITQLQVRQAAGTVYDNELLRILKRMPRWKPALADGMPIERTVSQQVKFYQDAEKIKVTF